MTETASVSGVRRRLHRGVVLPFLLGAAALSAATVGGLMLGGGANGLVGEVLDASAWSSNLLGRFGSGLGFGFAFGAGMVAAVNPCGFVMLPVYLGLYVSGQEDPATEPVTRRLVRALVVSAAVGLGFVVLFGATGLAVSAGVQSVGAVFPWIGLALGYVLVLVGAYVLAGGKLYSAFAARTASRIGRPRDSSMRGYFLFGISYGVASLSCALPIFLALVSGSVASGGFTKAAFQFLLYAGGMAFVIAVLTIAIALARGAVAGGVRKLLPYAGALSGALLVIVGAYLVFYWLTEGGLAGRAG